MALKDLLYRCPRCGHDPTEGKGDRVHCPACRCRFSRAPAGARIVVEPAEETPKHVPASRLSEAIAERGGPLAAARGEDGAIRYESRVEVRRGAAEETMRHGGEVWGFYERLGVPEPGLLRARSDALELESEGAETTRSRWNLLDLRAVQSSSSSVQIFTATGELVHFRFLDDSPVRWEALLHAVLQDAYERDGRGRILEFQPRIAVR